MISPARTIGPEVGKFFAANLSFADGSPFVPAPFQQHALDLIYELDADLRRQWRFVLWGIPRGNGKSPTCGGIADFELVSRQHAPNIFCAAAAREQAGIVHNNAINLARGGPLERYLDFPRVKEALGPVKCGFNEGILRVLSADGDLQQGLIPDVVIEDEPHAFTTGKQESLHFALTTALHKKADSVMVLITTAGESKQSLLGELFDAMVARSELEFSPDRCLMVGRDYESKSLLIWYGAPEDADVSDPKVWRACNPAPWITDESLKLAAIREPESVFRRFYLNQWVLGEDAAIQPGAWDACKRVVSPIPSGRDVWVGVDLGTDRDHSAVVVIHPRPCGRLRVMSKVFDPDVHRKGSLLELVEAELRRVADTYCVRAVGFDVWQIRDLANRLSADGMRMVEVPQNDSTMVPACGHLHDLVVEKVIMHDGDRTLREHILNAAAKTTSRGGWRFAKPMGKGNRADEKRKIDAAVALAMACAAWALDEKATGELWADVWG